MSAGESVVPPPTWSKSKYEMYILTREGGTQAADLLDKHGAVLGVAANGNRDLPPVGGGKGDGQ